MTQHAGLQKESVIDAVTFGETVRGLGLVLVVCDKPKLHTIVSHISRSIPNKR